MSTSVQSFEVENEPAYIAPAPRPLTFTSAIFAVFLGNILAAAVAGVAYYVLTH